MSACGFQIKSGFMCHIYSYTQYKQLLHYDFNKNYSLNFTNIKRECIYKCKHKKYF